MKTHPRIAHVTKQPASHLSPQRLILLGSTLLVALITFFIVRAAFQTPFTPQVTGQPRAVIDQTSFDYGDVINGSVVETTFHIKNMGDKELTVLRAPHVEVVEGCCPPQTSLSKSVLLPGAEATVTMSFSMHDGMDGQHEFRVHVSTNDPDNPEQEVIVRSNWKAS
jgi:hypothetical protein